MSIRRPDASRAVRNPGAARNPGAVRHRGVARHRGVVAVEAVERRALFASVAVTTLADAGAGSLRQAIADAQPGDTLDMTQLAGTITLASSLSITKDLTIAGPGASQLTISGNDHATQAMYVAPTVQIAISDLTIADAGTASSSGAIYLYDEYSNLGHTTSLTLERVVMSNNLSNSKGGAIYGFFAGLTLRECTFVDNRAGGSSFGYGGAVAIEQAQGLTIENSTFENNAAVGTAMAGGPPGMDDASAYGGAIVAYSNYGPGTITITNSTFVGNSATVTAGTNGVVDAAGISLGSNGPITLANNTIANNALAAPAGISAQTGGLAISEASALTFVNNLVAGNTGGSAPDLSLPSALVNGATNNLVSVGTNSNLTDGVAGNRVGTAGEPIDAKLGSIADHGGPTRTLSLLAGSPAIDAGTTAGAPTADQRGVARGATPDIGAFELASVTPTPDPDPNPAPDPDPTPAPTTIDLVVTGTDAADTIQVWTRLKGTQLRTVVNGRIRNYDASIVTSLTVNAGDGDDAVTINAGALGAVVAGGSGNDTLLGGSGDDTLVGNGGSDVIDGGDGDDRLNGNGGNDKLIGGAGDDRLYGGDGRDILVGGDGSDRLYGEAGADLYYAADNAVDRVYGLATDFDRADVDADDILAEVLAAIV